jgi:hypothetical protein
MAPIGITPRDQEDFNANKRQKAARGAAFAKFEISKKS